MKRLVLAGALFAGVVLSVHVADATVPFHFEDRLIASVDRPTAIAFTPDGRILLAGRTGRLYVFQNGALLATPALDLSTRICTNDERGLLGVAVSPRFTTNHWIYLYYTFKKAGTCEISLTATPVNRVARFVLSDSNRVDPASQTVLMDNIASLGAHNAGDLHFGKDGYLYVSIGDGRMHGRARDLNLINGKIIRITETGGVPPDNPYTGTGTARCNLTGRTSATACQEVYARGLRNPFRFNMDPNSASTRFFINDVGENIWEEVDLGKAGADYGWNVREGPCAFASTTNCGTPAGMTNPIYWYHHNTGCTAITASAFVPNGAWPGYDGAYLYGDFVCGKIFAMTPKSGGGYQATTFATGVNSIVAMTFGPYQGSQALYYINYTNGGQLHRIAFTGSRNRQPTADASADKTYGDLPLTVTFDGTGSSDPDGDALRYRWDFGEGIDHPTTAIASHTYQRAGIYQATLTVTDPSGLSDQAPVEIQAGNHPPVVTIDNPTPDRLFRVGEHISLSGHATDEGAPLADSSFVWNVVINHNRTHTHPYLTDAIGNNIDLTTPGPEDLPTAYNSLLQITLTATDSQGLSTTVSQDLDPHLVPLTFTTVPAGLVIQANDASYAGPTTLSSWEGFVVNLAAAAQRDGSGNNWEFVPPWSDGGAASHDITTPADATTYTATFQQVAAPPSLFADDFETGDLSKWTSVNGLQVQQSEVYSGNYAARGTSTGSPAYALKQLATPEGTLTAKVRFKLLRRSSSTLALIRFRAPLGWKLVSINLLYNGLLAYRNHHASLTRTSATNVTPGVWHDLQARVVVNGTASTVTVTYDGTTIASLNRTESLGSTKPQRFQLGDEATGHSYDIAFDELRLDRF